VQGCLGVLADEAHADVGTRPHERGDRGRDVRTAPRPVGGDVQQRAPTVTRQRADRQPRVVGEQPRQRVDVARARRLDRGVDHRRGERGVTGIHGH
jgi:hypothetical protein